MTPEAQIWKDRYYALKKWVEDNLPENKESNAAVAIEPAGEWNDYWESREK